jgi:hypothetical protein
MLNERISRRIIREVPDFSSNLTKHEVSGVLSPIAG